MSEEQPTPEELLNLERSLRALAPRQTTFDRDALMFAAGRQAATQRSRLSWPTVSLLAAVLGTVIGYTSGRHAGFGEVQLARPSVEADPELNTEIERALMPQRPVTNSYLSLRDRVLRDGVEALAGLERDGAQPAAPLQWRSGDFDL